MSILLECKCFPSQEQHQIGICLEQVVYLIMGESSPERSLLISAKDNEHFNNINLNNDLPLS